MNVKLKKIKPYLFIAPHLILFIIFFAVPAVTGILASFTKWNLYSSPEWVGFRNYYEILVNSDSTFYYQLHNGLGNTFKFVVFSVPFAIIVPLALAVALNTKVKGHKIFQSIFYIPSLLSISSVILTWIFMFHRNLGPINNILGLNVNWFGEQPFTWIAIVMITIWWTIGGNMVIYLAALAGVDKSLYEAASLDGANAIEKFFHITLPSMKNPMIYTIVMTTVAQFNVYGQPLMFSKGGPTGSTTVLLMYIKQLAFGSGEPIAGIASAMSVILGLCILAVTSILFIVMRNKD